jgi:hypothetical protein
MITLDEITLPDDLLWLDEYQWTPVAQQTDIMADGAVVVQADAQQTGRAITLTGGDDFGWIDRATLETLRGKANIAAAQMVLTLHDGTPRTVVFTGDRLTATQIYEHSWPEGTHPYRATLYFMEL